MTTSDKPADSGHPYHVAKKLVQAQKESELSLKELAARFGISRGHALNLIAAYEKMSPKVRATVFDGAPTTDEGLAAAKLSRDEQVASYEEKL